MYRPIMNLLILLPLIGSSVASATMYRWVNEEGVTVYSQTPPPAEIETQEIAPPPPPPTAPEPADAGSEPATFEPATAPAGTAAEQRKEAEERTRRNCENSKKNLAILQSRDTRTVTLPDGTSQTLNADAREEMIRKAEAQVQEFCVDLPALLKPEAK